MNKPLFKPLQTKFITQTYLPYLKKVSQIGLALFITSLAFFGPFSGSLAEGSLTSESADPLSLNSTPNSDLYSLSQDCLLGINPPQAPFLTKKIVVTAYSSTPDQTDNTPFITASGTLVKDGVVASNFLAFGTKIRFPQLYGDKIFIVEDRMHERFTNDRIDIWFPNRQAAQDFGIKTTLVEILP